MPYYLYIVYFCIVWRGQLCNIPLFLPTVSQLTLSRLLTVILLPEQFPNLLICCEVCLQWRKISTFPLLWNTSLSILFGLGLTEYYFRCAKGISSSCSLFMCVFYTVQLLHIHIMKLNLVKKKRYAKKLSLGATCRKLQFPLIKIHHGASNQDVWDETGRWRSDLFPAVLQTKWRRCLRITSTAPVSQSGADVIFSLWLWENDHAQGTSISRINAHK